MFTIKRLKQLVKRSASLRLLNVLRYGPAVVSRIDYDLVRESVYRPLNPGSFQIDLDQYHASVLRQTAHILDKGCCREDFEPNHGRQCYINACEALRQISGHEVLADPSVQWACKKIRDYEAMQKIPSRMAEAKPSATKITYEVLAEFIKSRRSIRNYLQAPICLDVLHTVMEAADWAPSSCNRQTTRVYGTNDPELVAECMKQCIGATCFSKFVPMFLCFCSDVRSYALPTEMFTPYIDVALGAQNSNLVAHAHGISMTMLTWASHTPDTDKRLRSILSIPDYCVIVTNAVGGYPSRGADIPLRKLECVTRNVRTRETISHTSGSEW